MLGELLKLGDLVSVTIPRDSRQWGYNPCEDGAVAEVLNFSEIHYGRFQNYYGKRPGVHSNNCWVALRFVANDKQQDRISTSHLKLVDEAEYERRLTLPHQEPETFIRDLPETALWESDVVEGDGQRLVVVRISYDCLTHTTNNGAPWPIYDCSNKLKGGWVRAFREDALTLVERGPVWLIAHDQPVEFESITEKAELFYRLGQTYEIKNPASGDYAWTKYEVLAALRNGTIHGFEPSCRILSSGEYCGVIRFHDEELGRQVAAETLKYLEG